MPASPFIQSAVNAFATSKDTLWKRRAHSPEGNRQGKGFLVDARPATPKFLCRMERRAGSAERIKHHVAGIAGRQDDALKKRHGFLCGIAQIFRMAP